MAFKRRSKKEQERIRNVVRKGARQTLKSFGGGKAGAVRKVGRKAVKNLRSRNLEKHARETGKAAAKRVGFASKSALRGFSKARSEAILKARQLRRKRK